jgi:hypothetical protein
MAVGGGAIAGLLIGIVAAGPYFYVWPLGRSAGVLVGLSLLGALVGWLVLSMALGLLLGGVQQEHSQGEEPRNAEGHREASNGYAEVVSSGESESAP